MELQYMMLIFILMCFMWSFMYKHMILILISLEFLMISMMMSIYQLMLINEINLFIFPIILTLSICEGIIGLSLFINLVRLSGNDFMNNLKITSWSN